MLKIYDTLSEQLHPFPVKNRRMKVLVCGPTVYDYAHVGHARLLLFYDLLTRFLRYAGGDPMVIINITDIDHKIYRKARLQKVNHREISSKFIDELLCDLALLGIGSSFCFAKVSNYIGLTARLILDLLDNKKAYSANGNIYLDTSIIPLGSLSKMSRQDLSDCRLDMGPNKKNPSDIMLWNTSESFDTKFHDEILGDGIPWWHMQDTAVAMGNFGGIYDIQGGATELVYPHHEFHLAQLCALTSAKKPVKLWTHVGLVYTGGKKMSKSLKNIVSIRDLLKDYAPNAIKLYLLSRHYRRRIEFSEKDLDKYAHLDGRILASLERLENTHSRGKSGLLKKFIRCLENDFDTESAVKIFGRAVEEGDAGIRDMIKIFGLTYR